MFFIFLYDFFIQEMNSTWGNACYFFGSKDQWQSRLSDIWYLTVSDFLSTSISRSRLLVFVSCFLILTLFAWLRPVLWSMIVDFLMNTQTAHVSTLRCMILGLSPIKAYNDASSASCNTKGKFQLIVFINSKYDVPNKCPRANITNVTKDHFYKEK